MSELFPAMTASQVVEGAEIIEPYDAAAVRILIKAQARIFEHANLPALASSLKQPRDRQRELARDQREQLEKTEARRAEAALGEYWANVEYRFAIACAGMTD